MRHHPFQRNRVWTVLFPILAALALNACSDVNNLETPPGSTPSGPLQILTSSPLPAGTTGVSYDITLALSGGNTTLYLECGAWIGSVA